MAKVRSQFACTNCGTVTSRWQGRCDSCGAWNTLQEERSDVAPKAIRTGRGRTVELAPLSGDAEPVARFLSGIEELDRVTGGGFVPGSALLVGGDPGIGKSTLLIQAAANLARQGKRVVYVSGEEAIDQVSINIVRASRIDSSRHCLDVLVPRRDIS